MIEHKTCKFFIFTFICLIVAMTLCNTAYADTMITDVDASASSYIAPYSPDRVVSSTPDPDKSPASSRWYTSQSGDKWIQLDLKQVHYIGRWYVAHLGAAG